MIVRQSKGSSLRCPVPLACIVVLAFLTVAAPSARSEQISIEGFIHDFSPTALGGIRKVIRYKEARPDRADTAIIFLGQPDPKGIPEQIEMLGPTGNQIHPVDSDGADCALERTALIRQNGVVTLIDAVRVFDRATLQAGYSSAAPFDLQVYRLEKGNDPTEPSLVFRASGKVERTMPLCSVASVQQAIFKAASAIR